MDILRGIAHPLLAAPFIVDGADAALNPESHAQKLVRTSHLLARLGLPELDMRPARLIARVSGALSAGLGMYFIVGRQKRAAAALLAANTVVIGTVNFPKPARTDVGAVEKTEEPAPENQVRRALRRARGHSLLGYGAAFGGLLLATVDRDGKPSWKWKRHYRAQEKELIKEIKEQARLAVQEHAA